MLTFCFSVRKASDSFTWPLGWDAGLRHIAGWKWPHSSTLSFLLRFHHRGLMVLSCPWHPPCPSPQASVILSLGEKGFSAQSLTFLLFSERLCTPSKLIRSPWVLQLPGFHVCHYALTCTRIKFILIPNLENSISVFISNFN